MRKTSQSVNRPPEQCILVDRTAFLSVLQLTSSVMQALGDEMEEIKASKKMPLDIRNILLQVIDAHLQNVGLISEALHVSFYDPADPSGDKLKEMN